MHWPGQGCPVLHRGRHLRAHAGRALLIVGQVALFRAALLGTHKGSGAPATPPASERILHAVDRPGLWCKAESERRRAQIVTPIGAIRVFSAVIGRHNVPHMLAAVAVALAAAHPSAMGDRSITLAVSAARSWLQRQPCATPWHGRLQHCPCRERCCPGRLSLLPAQPHTQSRSSGSGCCAVQRVWAPCSRLWPPARCRSAWAAAAAQHQEAWGRWTASSGATRAVMWESQDRPPKIDR